MGGSGSGYSKNVKLTNEELKKRFREESDAYLFDVEYEKLKAEREKVEEKYAKAREDYLRITEQLRQEMSEGAASEADMARFMAVLTDRGVQLQQKQAELEDELNDMAQMRANVDNKIEALRNTAFSGATKSYQPVKKSDDYKGFKNESGKDMGQAKVVEMRPEEYLRRVAYDFTGNGIQSLLNGLSASAIERYMRAMSRGTRYKSPSLNYKGKKTSGTERAIAALMNGYSKIPVMIIE